MPWNTVEEAEKASPGLKKHSDKAKRGWLSSFNGCMDDGGDESKCFAIAYSVANKVDKKACIDDRGIATELMRAAADLAFVEPRLAMGILQEAKAVKMKARALEFFQVVRDFRGELNVFIREMTENVRSPQALRAFPELKDVLELNVVLRRGVLRHTFLSEADLAERMRQVVELDAGAGMAAKERE